MSKIEKTETVTQDEFLESKLLEMMEAKLQQIESNEITLGITLLETEQVQGKMKTDKDGTPQTDPQTGMIAFWNDSYYAHCSFNGGEVKVKVSEEQYKTLVPSKKYLAKGRLTMVTPDKGFPYLKADLKDFHRIF